jgi:O-acetyl-ADP-ribose deacetylase (regulator of RNase III)
VIHAVGPIWQGGVRKEDRSLASAYRASLEVAEERGVASIAFPAISAGIYGYPIEGAANLAIGTVAAYLRRGSALTEVILVLYTPDDFRVYDMMLGRWQRAQAVRAQSRPETNDAT